MGWRLLLRPPGRDCHSRAPGALLLRARGLPVAHLKGCRGGANLGKEAFLGLAEHLPRGDQTRRNQSVNSFAVQTRARHWVGLIVRLRINNLGRCGLALKEGPLLLKRSLRPCELGLVGQSHFEFLLFFCHLLVLKSWLSV